MFIQVLFLFNSYFISERKPFLQFECVCKKIGESCLPDVPVGILIIYLDKIEEYFHLMKKYLPDWVEFVNLHGVEYIGMKFQLVNINDAIDLFNKATHQLKLG